MKSSVVILAVLASVAAIALAGDNVAWCMSKTTCGDCVKGVSCVWCPEAGPAGQGGCYHGKPWGKIDGADITSCKSYRYLQCKIPGLALLILVCAGVGILLILLFCCICCCCCCKGKGKSSTTVTMIPPSERYGDGTSSRDNLLSGSVNDGGSSYSAHPVTDARRRELADKYNKYNQPSQSYY